MGVVGNRRPRRDDAIVDPADEAFDLRRPVALRRSYIVAAAPRSGGTFLCRQLWKTGVLGAPSEYWSYPASRFGRRMAKRLDSSSHADYVREVIARRASKNGVFGVKALFKDFAHTLAQVPELLSLLAPVTYIYVDREDKLGHAVDLAKALQIERRASTRAGRAPPLRYDRNAISKCCGLLERERLDWMRWFERNGVDPLVVTYEELAADPTRVVRRIVKLFGVQGDRHEGAPRPPALKLRSSRINKVWATRFEREIREGIRVRRR